MIQTKPLTDRKQSVESHALAVLADRENIPFRFGQTQTVALDSRSAEFALDRQSLQPFLSHERFELFTAAPFFDQIVEGAGTVILVLIVVSGNVETVFIDADGMRGMLLLLQ